jgi:hypothetical protein
MEIFQIVSGMTKHRLPIIKGYSPEHIGACQQEARDKN